MTTTQRIARIASALPTVFLTVAAGCVLILAAGCVLILAAGCSHSTVHVTEQPSLDTVTTRQVVVCDYYLSHAAMVTSNAANITVPAAFCVVNGN